jgi:chromosome segregation ATPase
MILRPCCLLLLAGAVIAADGNGDSAVTGHLARLEARIAALEGRSTDPHARGAYAGGSSLRIDTGIKTDETVLERLRRLEREIGEARSSLATRDRDLAKAADDLAKARNQGAQASDTAAGLAHVEDSLRTAQQVLAERQGHIDGMAGDLAAAELARLKAERSHYQLAAALLRLKTGQTAELQDLQDQIRQQARELVGRLPAAETAAPAAPPIEPARPTAPPTAHGSGHGGH